MCPKMSCLNACQYVIEINCAKTIVYFFIFFVGGICLLVVGIQWKLIGGQPVKGSQKNLYNLMDITAK